jgi:ATP-dependent Clp protease ATP-binding subunit ClpA
MAYPVASDDLFLLAVAELREGTPARDVLESKGISVERLATEISSRALPMPAESSGLMFAPAYNSMAGRAEAFAASLGDGPISPEHVLMALIWDPSSLSSQLLWRLRVSRENIIRRAPLTRRGRPTHVDPASGRGRNGREDMDRPEEVQRVITELPKRLSPVGALRLQLRRRQGVGSR